MVRCISGIYDLDRTAIPRRVHPLTARTPQPLTRRADAWKPPRDPPSPDHFRDKNGPWNFPNCCPEDEFLGVFFGGLRDFRASALRDERLGGASS